MITFKSVDSKKTLMIGGGSAMGPGSDYGFVGPQPRYSISRENFATGDGTFFGTKHTISITGTAMIKSDDSQDMLTAGQRQSRIQGEAITAINWNRDEFPMFGAGQLSIEAYGGGGNPLEFPNATITSIELPEQNEETAGVQYLEYSFTFEAYGDSMSNTNTNAASEAEAPTELLSSVEETWDFSPGEAMAYLNDVTAVGEDVKEPFMSYTVTRTVSATGLKKFEAERMSDDGEAWRQAVMHVKKRVSKKPDEAQEEDIFANSDIKSHFNPLIMNKDDNYDIIANRTDNAATDESPQYKYFDWVRTVNSDMAGGIYSVTDTWTLLPINATSTHEFDVSVEGNVEGKGTSVTINGTVQGVSFLEPLQNSASDKYLNALSGYQSLVATGATDDDDVMYQTALKAYTDSGIGARAGDFLNVVKASSLSQNKTSGTITFSRTYDDVRINYPFAVKEDVTITRDNMETEFKNYRTKKVAIIGIIDALGNSGPVIQNMNTTDESKVNISIDLVMRQDHRSQKPFLENQPKGATNQSILDQIAAGSTTNNAGVIDFVAKRYGADIFDSNFFIQSFTENWNPYTGAYNLSIAAVTSLGPEEDV